MSVHQYIGARYVPVWYVNSLDQSSNWEVNVEYEPLTWVTTLNNHLYLSKKTVPDNIGTPASNPLYWLDMGVFAGSYQSLQDQIDDMNDGSVVGSLQYQINDMNDGSVVGSLQYQINDLGNGITALENAKKKRYVFVSDSYGTGAGYAVTPWINTVISRLGLTPDDYSIQAVNGAAFGNNQLSQQAIDGCNDGKNNLGWTEDENIYVVVGGGFNDRGITKTDLTNAMTAMKTGCRTLFPNCHICIAYIAGSTNITYKASINATFSTYRDVCEELALEFWGNVFPAIPTDAFMRPDPSDEIHPNQNGQNRIADLISQCILTGNCSNTLDVAFTAPLFGDTNHNLDGRLEIKDGIVRIHMGTNLAYNYNFATAASWTFNSPAPVYDIAVGVRACRPITKAYNLLTNKTGGTGWKNVNGFLIMEDYHIKFVPMVYGADVGIDQINNSYIPPFDIECTVFDI